MNLAKVESDGVSWFVARDDAKRQLVSGHGVPFIPSQGGRFEKRSKRALDPWGNDGHLFGRTLWMRLTLDEELPDRGVRIVGHGPYARAAALKCLP